jgi:hypothetical protein
VLGDPGAGKTILLVRLVLELLARRQAGDPVPVLVPLAGWNPVDQDLPTWLATRLAVDYPALADSAPREAGAVSRARALLDQHLLLPILDGLDELPEAAWRRAVSRLNDWLAPRQGLVLASRTAAYRKTIIPTDLATELPVQLRGAAGISLRPLDPDDVRAYLRRDAVTPAAAARWDPVLATLGTSTPAAQALTTPLLVGLARTIYNPRPGEHTGVLPDPAELCSRSRFQTRAALRAHLFDAFIPAAYRPHPDPKRRRPWSPEQAERWLVFLARHLEDDRNGTTDLAWWELHRAGPQALLDYVREAWVKTEPFDPIPARGLHWYPFAPDILGILLTLSLVGGLVVGFGSGLVAGLAVSLTGGLLAGLMFGFVVKPADLAVAAEPRAVLVLDRRTSLILALTGPGLAFGVMSGLVAGVWLVHGLGAELWVGVVAGLPVGLAVGLPLGLMSGIDDAAWGAFKLTHCWLALRRRLPWRLMSFLADAHQQRSVLRQAGAVYQFRHADLQDRLATRPARSIEGMT